MSLNDFRVARSVAVKMTSREIVDHVLFGLGDAAPSMNSAEYDDFFDNVNPVTVSLYAAWMAVGLIANGGLSDVHSAYSSAMVWRAAYGFRILGSEDVAYALEVLYRKFPAGVLPADSDLRERLDQEWCERCDAGIETESDQTLAEIEYSFDIYSVYNRTDELLRRYYWEFVRP